jgi:hypothetical protein
MRIPCHTKELEDSLLTQTISTGWLALWLEDRNPFKQDMISNPRQNETWYAN